MQQRLLICVGLILLHGSSSPLQAQLARTSELTPVKVVPHTSVKNQANTGTCWSFSVTSLLEAQAIHRDGMDLSEMFTVRNIYTEKARNYIFRQGAAQFGPGGLGHDVIRSIERYGAVPEQVYSGLPLGVKKHNHSELDAQLKHYLDSLLKIRPVPADWMKGFQSILDAHLGTAPETFTYHEKRYTPRSFADEVLRFKAEDYVNITSFTHHPFYKAFILEVPDNFSNGMYYNVPLDELIKLTKGAITQGYSLMWDADVSNTGFQQRVGYAMNWKEERDKAKEVNPDAEEGMVDQAIRQSLYENLTTQDDHLMHLVGLEKSIEGKVFFLVKNSWGEVGPLAGYIYVSEAYFALNTISLVVPKAALDESLKTKLGLK